MAADYAPIIQQAAQEWNLDPHLLQALIEQESSGDPTKVSKAGARGLTGLMPDTAKGIGVTDLADPTQQIYGGAKYLSQALDAEKTPEDALRYYHGGPDWRNSYGPESAAYAPAITARYTKMAQADKTQAGGSQPAPAPTDADNDPFTAALKGAQGEASGKADASTADPFSQALTEAQKATAPAATPETNSEAPGAHPATSGQNIDPITGFPVDDNGAPIQGGKTVNAGVDQGTAVPGNPSGGNIVNAAVEGAKEGFGSGPLGLSPQSQTSLENAGVYNKPGEYNPLKAINRAVINPLAAAGDLALRSGGALLGAYQHGVAQAGTEIGQPALGRDLAALPEAFPTGDYAGGTAIPHAPVGVADVNPLTAAHQDVLDRQAAALQARTPTLPPANPLAAEVNAPAFVPPGATIPPGATPAEAAPPAFVPPGATRANPLSTEPRVVPNALVDQPPAPSGGAPVPQSVGAAASRDMTMPASIPPQTAEQKLTNLEKSVTQSAEDRAGPQLEDHNVYVPGVERPEAARVFTPQNSLDDKTLRATDPEYRREQETIERNNNQVMVDLLGKDAGDANAMKAAHDERDEVAPPAQQLFAGEQPVDAAPLAQHIDSILAGPAGKRSAVVRTLTAVKNSLFDADGNLETLPSQLYGARQNITDLLKKGVGDGADDVRASKPILTGLLDKMDPIINEGAPKYQTYLDQFHEASQPINQMEFLQKYQTGSKKLTNVDGYLQLGKVQKMLDDIYQGQKAKGINPAKSLTDDQVQNVVNVRNELAAQSLKDRLAKVKGSDTTQQTNRVGVLGDGPLGTAVKGAAEMGAHALLFHTTGGIGNAAMAIHRAVVKPAREASKAARAENALVARKAELLNTQPNPLTP